MAVTLDEKAFVKANEGSGRAAEQAMKVAVAEVVRSHKAHGRAIPIWQDGKVVWIPAEEIVVPDEEPEKR